MFKGLSKIIGNFPTVENNILSQIAYQYFTNNDIVWYDNAQAEVFVNRGYRGNANVYAIVRKIGDKNKIAPLLVYTEKSGKNLTTKYKQFKYSGNSDTHTQSIAMRSKALEFAEGTDLGKLLRQPNPHQTWSEFMDDISGFYNTCGEAFIYGVGPGEDSKNFGKYTELYAMPSHLVTIVAGDIMNPVKGYKLRIGDVTKVIEARDVCHIKMFNPYWTVTGDQLRGQSPLLAGLKYLKRNDVGLYSSSKLLENRGAETIVSPNHPDSKYWLNPNQVTATEQALGEKINGPANKGKTVVSGMPLQAIQLGLSPQALQIIESMNDDVTTLCSLWGIDPILLGRGTGTYSNQEQARKALVTDITIPFLNMIEQKLMQWLVPAYSKSDKVDYIIDFDTTVYPELQSDMKLIKEVYLDSQVLTTDEKRVMINFDERGTPDADVILVDAGKVQLADAASSLPDDGEAKDLFGDYR